METATGSSASRAIELAALETVVGVDAAFAKVSFSKVYFFTSLVVFSLSKAIFLLSSATLSLSLEISAFFSCDILMNIVISWVAQTPTEVWLNMRVEGAV